MKELLLALLFSIFAASAFSAEEPLSTIAFGSCNFQRLPQGHWDVIAKDKPQLWIWGGDIIYADPFPPSLRAGEYRHLKNTKAYTRFRAAVPTILGTWDDHDYGSNDSGKEYSYKKETQQLLLDFLDEPKESPRRRQEGVYASYVYGPEGKRVKVILLDLRYHRDAPGPDADLLGATQWAWLERELDASNTAELTLLMSSSQVLPTANNGEKWADYPRARERLLKLLADSKSPLLLLSGDMHFAEISRAPLPDGREAYEVMASGLTHADRRRVGENRARLGTAYTGKNYGLLRLKWTHGGVDVAMELHSVDGKTQVQHMARFSKVTR